MFITSLPTSSLSNQHKRPRKSAKLWYTLLRASLQIQAWSPAASHLPVPRTLSWQQQNLCSPCCPSCCNNEERGQPQCPAPFPVSCPGAGGVHALEIGTSPCNLFCTGTEARRQAGSCAKHLKGLGLKIHLGNPLQFLKC